jgi:hypothetical protein
MVTFGRALGADPIVPGFGQPRVTIAPRRGIAMPYFDPSADKLERVGKVIGDIISAIIVVGFLAIFAYQWIGR